MPIPAPPTLGYSFTTFSSTNPTGQQPGDKIDAEFNRVYNTLNSLIGAVNASMNADGSLKSAAVEAAEGSESPPEDGINIWDIPSQNSATLSQAWAEHMDGPVPVEFLAYGGVDGTHWSAAFYADQAAIIAANLVDQVTALLAAFNFPIASPTTLGGVIPTAGGGLLVDIAGHLTVNFDLIARVDDARILGAQQRSEKNLANGYAGLNSGGLLLSSVMPFATATTRGAVSPKTGLTVDGSGNVYVDFGIDAGKVMQANDPRVVGAEQTANKGQPSGYPPLDATGLIPASFIPAAASPGGTGGTGVLTAIPSLNFLANTTTGSALPTATDLTTFLDTLVGDYRGAFLCRRSYGWDTLHPGTDGYVLTSQGFGLTPHWVEAPTAIFPSIANLTFIANTSGAAAVPVEKTLTAFLDAALANTQGAIVYRGPTAWAALGPGTAGQLLRTGGAAANPSWVNAPSGGGGSGVDLDAIGSTQGDILYRGTSAWAALAPGTTGQILRSNGAAANPSWEDAPSGGGGSAVYGALTPLGGYKAGNFYTLPMSKTRGVAPSADWMAAYPFFVNETCSLKTLSIQTYGTNSGTASVRMCIFTDNNGVPDALVSGSDTGVVSTSSSVSTITSPTLNSGSGVTLVPGVYWAVSNTNGLGGMGCITFDREAFDIVTGVLTGASSVAAAFGTDTTGHAVYATSRSFSSGFPSTWGTATQVQWWSFPMPGLGF